MVGDRDDGIESEELRQTVKRLKKGPCAWEIRAGGGGGRRKKRINREGEGGVRRGAVLGGPRHRRSGRKVGAPQTPGARESGRRPRAGEGGGERPLHVRYVLRGPPPPPRLLGSLGLPSVPEPRLPGVRGGLAAGGGRGREKVAPLVCNLERGRPVAETGRNAGAPHHRAGGSRGEGCRSGAQAGGGADSRNEAWGPRGRKRMEPPGDASKGSGAAQTGVVWGTEARVGRSVVQE